MSFRHAALAALLLAGCQAVPQAGASADALTGHERLLNRLLDRSSDPLREASEPVGLIELNSRLAVLSRQLDDLLARSSSASSVGVAEAAAQLGSAADSGDAAAIALLQQAIQTNEQCRHVILENLVNAQTAGFKKRQVSISTTLHSVSGLQLPSTVAVVPVWTSGALEITERSLDVAIDGDGLFAVIAEDGSLHYTRDGNFQLNAEGKIVTAGGRSVVPEITVPNDTLEISIDPAGHVTGRTASCPDRVTRFGQMNLSRFVNMSGLAPAGKNALRWTAECGPAITAIPGRAGLGDLKQGFLERSNVTVINELANLQIVEQQRNLLRRLLANYGIYVP